MQVANKFMVNNASYRQVYCTKCKLSTSLLYKMQVIEKFTVENVKFSDCNIIFVIFWIFFQLFVVDLKFFIFIQIQWYGAFM